MWEISHVGRKKVSLRQRPQSHNISSIIDLSKQTVQGDRENSEPHGMATGLPGDESRCKDTILQVGHDIKYTFRRILPI